MKKILLLANDTTYVYNLRAEVLSALLGDGFAVTVASRTAQHTEELTAMGCKLVPVEMDRHGKNPLQDLVLLRFYQRLLVSESPDVVLTYNIKPNVYGGLAAARAKIPYLVNVCGLGTPVETPGPLQTLTCFLYKQGVKRASCVFFQNRSNYEFFVERGMLAGHSHLLPGSGVNLSKYEVLPYPKGDTVEFLFISRVMREKGIDQYLDAAEAIRARHPETVFHILGGCDDEAYLERLKSLQEKGVILYHGQQKEVLSFQRRSCCTVHPTYYPEGMSNVLLETAACGRPIITTDRSGCREIIEDGVNGFICRQKDSADLIRQLERFLALPRDKRREMGLAGRAKVEREFDRQFVVDAYREEIGRALRKE